MARLKNICYVLGTLYEMCLDPLVVYLDPVVVGVGHNNLLLHAQAEAVRRVELALPRPQGPELAADLHRIQLHTQINHLKKKQCVKYQYRYSRSGT